MIGRPRQLGQLRQLGHGATAEGTDRVFRGGGYWDRAGDCTASYRYWDNLDYRDG